jgi:acetyl coenzyme A synthetase (ADP forming)-like protein
MSQPIVKKTKDKNMNKLKSIFYPRSIAVIGASRKPGSVGQSLLANIIGSRIQGIVYPVNPEAKGIIGIKSYPTITEIPDVVDLAIIIVPSQFVLSVLDECGQKGVKGVIIISAGFKEIGGTGIELEQEVKNIIQKYDISLLGPNCLGVINTDPKSCLNATFGMQFPRQGNISFVSQSGALCVAVLEYAKEANVGFAKFISMGNKADINENELLLYLKEDPKTDVILMYLEDLVNGREFMRIARETTSNISKPKPIIALKAGSTVLGARAASSHTGSLAGSDKVYDAIFEQCGVLRVETLEELFDYVRAFSSQPLPKGNNVAIVTNSGGPGILATDSCIQYGLNMTSLRPQTVQALKKVLPPTASFDNPVDLIGDARHDRYEASLKEVLKDKNVHSSIVILTPTAFTNVEKIATSIVDAAKAYKKPVLACFLGVYDVSKGIEILEENGIPAYRFPESAARVLSEMTKYTWWLQRPKTGVKKFKVNKTRAKKIFESVEKEGRHFLLEQEAYQVLEAYKFPITKSTLAKDERQAVEAASKLGFPVAMKIVSPDILHKFDYGGVKLDLKSQREVRQAYRQILKNVRAKKPKARITGIIVETMAAPGKEVILGMSRNPQFGPILMFGLGGIYVEALEDVTFRLAPIRELTASMMIKKTKTYSILDGFRGGPIYDIPAIEECLKRLSQLVSDFDQIKELDINPLIVHEKGKGCTIVDARIILD